MRDEEMPVLQAYRAYKTNRLLEESMKSVRLNARRPNKANIPKYTAQKVDKNGIPLYEPRDHTSLKKRTVALLQGIQNKLLKPFEIPQRKSRYKIEINYNEFMKNNVNRLTT